MGMRKNVTCLFTIFSILFFLFVFSFLAVRTFRIRANNIAVTMEQFEDLTNAASDLWKTEGTLDTENFLSFMREAYRGYERLISYTIYSEDYGTVYLSARNPSSLDGNINLLKDQQKVPEIEHNRLYQNKTVLPLKQFNSSFLAAGVFTVINEEDIFPLLTDALFILAGFAVLTGALLIISGFSGREPRTAAAGSSGKTAYEKQKYPAEKIIQSPPPEISEGFKDLSEENPGLFNPRTGLSHGTYLEKRLSSELERSAANEQDLTLLLMRVSHMEYDDEIRAEAGNLTGFFTFEDMIFQYSENIFAVILANTNLDEAIGMAERYQEKTSGAEEPQRSFGLSSRNGRLIDGERLIVESTLALKKTDERNPIVGFRPDPNKYRDYLSSKRQKGKAAK